VPLVVHYWTDLQSVYGFCCYDSIAPKAKCQRVLVLGLCLVYIFGRPFVTRFALCYRTVVCLSVCRVCLCVCNVGVLWPNGWVIKMKLGTLVGLGPGHILLDRNPAPPKNGGLAPKFSAYVYCGQTAGWIKMSLVTEVASA